jgi:hypothetical protein
MSLPGRWAAWLSVLAGLVGLVGLATAARAYERPELRPWPGPGFRTEQGSWLRPLDPRVSFSPLVTVGDSILGPFEDAENFLFYPMPSGLGLENLGHGLAEVYVCHQTTWEDGIGSGRVSRLLFDERTHRVVAADWIVDGETAIETFEDLGGAFLADTHEGFLTSQLFVNEGSLQGPNHGVVAAVNVRNGFVTPLPWLGRFQHDMTFFLPLVNGRLAAILTENGDPGRSQLYMYLADSDTDFMSGRGRLYVLRADSPNDRLDTQSASMARKTKPPLTGRFVPLQGFTVGGDPVNASAVELSAQAAHALDFVRLGDVALDPRNPGAFFLSDLGDENYMDPVSGRPVTGNGRIYRIELDPFDPTLVREIRVVLDGDEADDIYRPHDLDADMQSLMIQEDPSRRGIRPSRILRYNLITRRLEVLAECAERDPQGRMIAEGTGGLWRTAGILDASGAFGPGSWLVTVQARNDPSTTFNGHGGGGQLLLMRTSAFADAKKKR